MVVSVPRRIRGASAGNGRAKKNGRRFRRPFGRTVGVSTDDSRWCFAYAHLPAATVWCGLVCETWSLGLCLSTVSTRGASDLFKIAQGSGFGGQGVNRELGCSSSVNRCQPSSGRRRERPERQRRLRDLRQRLQASCLRRETRRGHSTGTVNGDSHGGQSPAREPCQHRRKRTMFVWLGAAPSLQRAVFPYFWTSPGPTVELGDTQG